MKLVVVGASGRMGQTLIQVIHETPGLELSGAIEREGAPELDKDIGELAGVGSLGVKISDDPASAFAEADGVIDFTTPEASIKFARLASQKGITHIIGTTGCTPEDETELAIAARRATIVKSGNMSLGVNLLAALAEQAAKVLDPRDFDIEILEMHHGRKVDAPSGTALLLGEAVASGREIDLKDNMEKNRDGMTGPRQTGAIGFSVLRGGGVIGEHSVFLAGKDEMIELSHRAMDRRLFARGALKAALWGRDKAPGLYSMKDVLGFNA